ncbi:MAG: hypothetical protein R2716_12025 [Microthrixaceae bacterium]
MHEESDLHTGADAPATPEPDQLEADIASVASALETLERLLAEAGGDGDSMRTAASDIARVVSPERFPLQ